MSTSHPRVAYRPSRSGPGGSISIHFRPATPSCMEPNHSVHRHASAHQTANTHGRVLRSAGSAIRDAINAPATITPCQTSPTHQGAVITHHDHPATGATPDSFRMTATTPASPRSPAIKMRAPGSRPGRPDPGACPILKQRRPRRLLYFVKVGISGGLGERHTHGQYGVLHPLPVRVVALAAEYLEAHIRRLAVLVEANVMDGEVEMVLVAGHVRNDCPVAAKC